MMHSGRILLAYLLACLAGVLGVMLEASLYLFIAHGSRGLYTFGIANTFLDTMVRFVPLTTFLLAIPPTLVILAGELLGLRRLAFYTTVATVLGPLREWASWSAPYPAGSTGASAAATPALGSA